MKGLVAEGVSDTHRTGQKSVEYLGYGHGCPGALKPRGWRRESPAATWYRRLTGGIAITERDELGTGRNIPSKYAVTDQSESRQCG